MSTQTVGRKPLDEMNSKERCLFLQRLNAAFAMNIGEPINKEDKQSLINSLDVITQELEAITHYREPLEYENEIEWLVNQFKRMLIKGTDTLDEKELRERLIHIVKITKSAERPFPR